MDQHRRSVLLSIGAGGMALAAPGFLHAAAASTPLAGVWSGYIDSDDPPTRIRLEVNTQNAGTLTVFTTVDEIAVPISTLVASGPRLHLEVAQPYLTYEAQLASDGVLRGTLVRGTTRLPLTFVRGDLYSEPPYRPVSPQKPSPGLLRKLRVMSRAPAMGVGWQVAGRAARVLIDGRRSTVRPGAVSPADVWHLGSVTKSVTATLAARLVEQGKLEWTSRVGDLLDGLAGPIPQPFREVSLLHLLSHRGGLPRDVPENALREFPDMSAADYVRRALDQPATGPLGAQMFYSNVDYVVAGLMLEAATGGTWQKLMEQQVLAALGITDAVFAGAGDAEGVSTIVGHSPGRRGLVPDRGDIPTSMAAAGRIRMSLGSLLVYLKAHRDMPADFLSPRSWSVLHTPPFGGNYALGWDVATDGVISHGGTNQRWKCEVRVNPKTTVASCSAANVLNRNTQLALLQLLDCADVV